jgi:hypothetical protein
MKLNEFKSRFKMLKLVDQKQMLKFMEADIPNKTKELNSDELNNVLNLIQWCKEFIESKELSQNDTKIL